MWKCGATFLILDHYSSADLIDEVELVFEDEGLSRPLELRRDVHPLIWRERGRQAGESQLRRHVPRLALVLLQPNELCTEQRLCTATSYAGKPE